jgi:hypothetical protein
VTDTLNGIDLLHVQIREPLDGRWVAWAALDHEEAFALGSAAVLVVGGESFVGTWERCDIDGGKLLGMVSGGAGDLQAVQPSKFYDRHSLGMVLADIMAGAGDVLSSDVSSTILTHRVPHWLRTEGPGMEQLRRVAEEVKAEHVRLLRDGTVWLGAEDWAEVSPDGQRTDARPSEHWFEFRPEEAPELRPGVTFEGLRIGTVVTTSSASGLVQRCYYLNERDQDQDEVALMRAAMVREAQQRALGGYWFAAKVVAQNASDLTIEVIPEDARVRGLGGLTKIPIRWGIPGCTAKVNAGARVRVFCDDGRASKYSAALWDDGAVVTEIKLGGSATNYVALANLVLTELQDIKAWADAHTHTCAAPASPSSSPVVPMPAPSSVAAAKVKAE